MCIRDRSFTISRQDILCLFIWISPNFEHNNFFVIDIITGLLQTFVLSANINGVALSNDVILMKVAYDSKNPFETLSIIKTDDIIRSLTGRRNSSPKREYEEKRNLQQGPGKSEAVNPILKRLE
eukprot:TRINITY_DN17479_c0_g1_i1.p1 TRINITY_DN17479_c0_g1~~TRINITY_DN17479_c0_g1_i1.p1  ORF type:complete len:124 (-),score=10.66 TRINITY_DN17479_c0_g1_i1:9-380(-)